MSVSHGELAAFPRWPSTHCAYNGRRTIKSWFRWAEVGSGVSKFTTFRILDMFTLLICDMLVIWWHSPHRLKFSLNTQNQTQVCTLSKTLNQSTFTLFSSSCNVQLLWVAMSPLVEDGKTHHLKWIFEWTLHRSQKYTESQSEIIREILRTIGL